MADKGITLKFNSDTAEAAEKANKLFEGLASGLEKLKVAAVVLVFAKLGQEILKAAEAADQLGKTSQKIGIAVEKLSALAVAARLADVSIEELGQATAGLARHMSDADAGSKQAQEVFQDLGISVRNVAGELKSVDTVLAEVADRFADMPDGVTKTRLAQELFERSGRNLIPLLNGGSAGLRALKDEAREYGLIVGPQFAANAERFNDNLTRFKLIAQGVFLQLANALLPEMIRLSEIVLDFVRSWGLHNGLVGTVIDVYKLLAGVVASVATAFEALFATIGAFAGNFSATLDPFAAWNASADVLKEKLAGLDKRLTDLAKLGDPATGGGGRGTRSADQAEERRRLRAQFEDAQKELDLRVAEHKLTAEEIKLRTDFSPEERQKLLNAQLADEIRLLEKKLLLSKEAEDKGIITPFDRRQLNVQDRAAITAAQGQQTPESAIGTINQALVDLGRQWGTLAQQIAESITSLIGNAINSISNQITGVILGTQKWAQALRNIGTSILGEVINSIIKMGLQWILTHTIMAAAGKAIASANVAATAPIAAAQAGIWATPAALATIASYGGAAAAAPGLIAASTALVHAVALIPGFAEGGWTGGGYDSEAAGLVHRNEYVFSAPTVRRLGVNNLEAMERGSAPGGGGGGAQINLAILNDERQVPDWMRTSDGEQHVVNIVKKNWYQIQR